MLLVVPGVIASIGFMFWAFIVVDKGLSAVEVLKASWQLTNGHKIQLFLFMIGASIVNSIGVFLCGVGLLITLPITVLAFARLYDMLAEPGNAYMET